MEHETAREVVSGVTTGDVAASGMTASGNAASGVTAAGVTASGMAASGNAALGMAAWGWIGVGLVLRLGRALCRWDEPVFDYAAYYQPLQSALGAGDLFGATRLFSGLHPPLYGLLFSLIDALYPAPLAWILGSSLLSILSVWLVAQAAGLEAGHRMSGTVGAAWMAVAPVQLAYSAEVSDYPLLGAAVAGLLWTAARFRAGRGGWSGVVAASVVAAWTHALGGVAAVAVLVAAGGSRRRVLGGLGVMAVLCAPLAVPVLRLAGEASTFRQPIWSLEARAALLWTRFGWGGAVTLGLVSLGVAAGLVRGPRDGVFRTSLAVLGALIAALAVFLALHVAAPHQFPYLVALGPPAALLAALGIALEAPAPVLPGPHTDQPSLSSLSRSVPFPLARSLSLAALLLLAGVGISATLSEARALTGIWRDQQRPRAIDAALASAHPGDALWLITPYQPDDDKRLTSPVLWRMPPWEPMPAARPFDFDPTDFHFGTPRRWRELTVYLFTRVFPGPMRTIAAHHAAHHQAVRIVLYDGEREPGLQRDLEAFLASLGAHGPVQARSPAENAEAVRSTVAGPVGAGMVATASGSGDRLYSLEGAP